MGKFRDLMDKELRIRGYSANTRACDLRCVRHFVRHFMVPPNQRTHEQIHRDQFHLARDRQVSWSSFDQDVCSLRFFYREVLKRDWKVRHIHYQKTGRKLPEILSPAEVAALLRAPNTLKPRALGRPLSGVLHVAMLDRIEPDQWILAP